jgi:simple sugar transport system permease protein
VSVALVGPRGGRREVLLVALAFATGMLLLTLFLWLAGFDALAALSALWQGAFGSRYAILSATLVRATPLLLLGLAFAIGARAGAFNIGMEGQFAAGAIAATWAGLSAGSLPPPIAVLVVLVAGTVAGAAWMLVPLALRLRLGVTEVISTLLLNFVAEALVSWCVSGPLQEASATYPQSDPIAMAARLPRLVPDARLHAGLVVGLVLALVLWVALRRTGWGFRVRAVGAGPTAARVAGGMNPERVLAGALLLSGALAGLGGAVEVGGVSFALYQNLSPGYGFTAIAVALLGRLHPGGIVLAAVLFGGLEAGAGAMQRDAGVPAVAVQVVQAVTLLTLVVVMRRRS